MGLLRQGHKNDFRDAHAVAEAVQRPSTRCVPIKTDDQLDLQALHRVRSRLIGDRTAVINQLRGFLLEEGTREDRRQSLGRRAVLQASCHEEFCYGRISRCLGQMSINTVSVKLLIRVVRRRCKWERAVATPVASVMVHVDFDGHSDSRIRIAAEIANRFDAVLIGVAGWLPSRERGGWLAAELASDDERLDRISVELDRLAERFRSVAHRTVGNMEWRKSFHFPREVITTEARAADLVVIGSHSHPEDAYHVFDPGMVLLNAGRPVLVVPDGLGEDYPGRRALVAWKDTREARHAVQSALPYLRMAEHIALVEVAENAPEAAARARLLDVDKYLARHGIAVKTKVVLEPDASISDQLINEARKQGADLIVAGAYGHTRLAEWVFGGVTRGFLQNSDICCLFSN